MDFQRMKKIDNNLFCIISDENGLKLVYDDCGNNMIYSFNGSSYSLFGTHLTLSTRDSAKARQRPSSCGKSSILAPVYCASNSFKTLLICFLANPPKANPPKPGRVDSPLSRASGAEKLFVPPANCTKCFPETKSSLDLLSRATSERSLTASSVEAKTVPRPMSPLIGRPSVCQSWMPFWPNTTQ